MIHSLSIELFPPRCVFVTGRYMCATGEQYTMTDLQEGKPSALFSSMALLVSLLAGAVAFLPFAFNTSPWDAITLRVPGNQGNWWHALVGAPFFLAFPMIWFRLCGLFSKELPISAGRHFVRIISALSICGTIMVEVPFLLHLAGTRGWPRFSMLSAGFGIIIVGAAILFTRWSYMSAAHLNIACLNTAYLANAALCLIVYNHAPGTLASKSGWLITAIIVWPMLLELSWIFVRAFKTPPSQNISVAY